MLKIIIAVLLSYAYADSKENQIKFAELLSPIFADLSKLEAYVKSADRSRFDD